MIWRQHELIDELRYLGRILAGSLARKKATERILELRRFEELLSQVSATYINLPIEDHEVMDERLGVRAGRFITDHDLGAGESVLGRDDHMPELFESLPRVAELENLDIPAVETGAIPCVRRGAYIHRRDQRAFLHRPHSLRPLSLHREVPPF